MAGQEAELGCHSGNVLRSLCMESPVVSLSSRKVTGQLYLQEAQEPIPWSQQLRFKQHAR